MYYRRSIRSLKTISPTAPARPPPPPPSQSPGRILNTLGLILKIVTFFPKLDSTQKFRLFQKKKKTAARTKSEPYTFPPPADISTITAGCSFVLRFWAVNALGPRTHNTAHEMASPTPGDLSPPYTKLVNI